MTSLQFPTPGDATWNDVSVEVIGSAARITVKDVTREVLFHEMGFGNRRTRRPDKQWDLLVLLASREGVLRRSDPAASLDLQGRKEKIAKRLSDYFGIDEPPIAIVNRTDWQCRFQIKKNSSNILEQH